MNFFEQLKKAGPSVDVSEYIKTGIKNFDALIEGKGIPPGRMLSPQSGSPYCNGGRNMLLTLRLLGDGPISENARHYLCQAFGCPSAIGPNGQILFFLGMHTPTLGADGEWCSEDLRVDSNLYAKDFSDWRNSVIVPEGGTPNG